MKKRKTMKLQTKLILLVIAVVFVSITIIISFVGTWITKNIEQEAMTNIMNVAEFVAHSGEVVQALEQKDPQKTIASYVELQLKNLTSIDYIIVADQKGIRYSHPNEDMIGKHFAGGDEYRAAFLGETYISKATGTLGTSLRAFAPIFDEENEEIGFVCVGTLIERINVAKQMAIFYIILIGFGGLFIGSIGAFLLSNNIKHTLLGLEPEEISRLYHEKTGILDAIHEGLVAIDAEGRITLMNDSAFEILHYNKKNEIESILGHSVEEVIPNTRMLNVLKTGEAELDDEQRLNNTVIVTNRIPIFNKGKVVGVIASFRDKTQMAILAEELTGAKKLAWSLRAQNHEFMNKLHTIAGLIQLEEYEEALKFIEDVAKVRNNISNLITRSIKDNSLAALLLSKYNKAEESRVKLEIDEASKLTKLPKNMRPYDLISIVGNLIENSLEEVKNDGSGCIYVKIVEEEDTLVIEVKDNGKGILPIHQECIFLQGFSTKEGQRGHGMYIVKRIVDEFNGQITLVSEQGVSWNITIPMRGGENV